MKKGIIYVYFNKAKYEKEGVEKYYVGQTVKTMEERAGKDGKNYHWTNPNCNTKFANSIRKWGWNSFEYKILEEVYEEDLDELEKFYIEYFDSFKNGYNTALGGEGARGYNFSEESKKKLSISSKKRWKNPKEIKRQSEAIKKHFQNPEERRKLGEKMSIISKKRFQNPEERKKLGEKMSIISKKRFQNKSEREKCSKPGESNPYAKKVYCDTLNIVFSYIGLAEKYCINILNSKASGIGLTCNGKIKSSGKLTDGTKLTWNWIENVNKEILDNAIYIDSKKYEEIINERKKCGIPCKLNPNERNVYCSELNIIFSYVGLAEKYCKNVLNSKIGRIRYACDGKLKSTGEYNGIKLTWNWTENLDKKTLNNAEYIDSKKYEEIINKRKKCGIPRELNYYTTSVYCEELSIVFSYAKLAEKYCKNVLNIKIGPISLTCDGKRKSTGIYNGKKLHWSWTKNLDEETLNNAEYIDSKKYEEIINAKINN